MNDQQFQQFLEIMDKRLEIGIETNVNGKIKNLTAKLDEYIKDDNEWKAQALPAIELGKNAIGFGKALSWILGIGLAVLGVIKYFNK